VKLLNQVIDEDSSFCNAYLLQGDIYYDMKEPERAINAYEHALRIDSASFPLAYFLMANLQFDMEKYDLARRNYSTFLQFRPKNQSDIRKAEQNISLCEVRSDLMKHPVPFDPQNMGPAINSDGYEYINSVSMDEELMLFTRKGIGPGDQRVFFRPSNPGTMAAAVEMEPPVKFHREIRRTMSFARWYCYCHDLLQSSATVTGPAIYMYEAKRGALERTAEPGRRCELNGRGILSPAFQSTERPSILSAHAGGDSRDPISG
jgi:tetratricopeptide (TPR) repeat protein